MVLGHAVVAAGEAGFVVVAGGRSMLDVAYSGAAMGLWIALSGM